MGFFSRRKSPAASTPARGKTTAKSNSTSFATADRTPARGADGMSELTLTKEPDLPPAVTTGRQIDKAEVLDRWGKGSRWSDDGTVWEEWCAEYVEPVTAFGLQVRVDEHAGITAWDALKIDVPAPVLVDLDKVRYSTQPEGVILSVLAEVIANGTDEAPCDPEGWFDNPRPLLMRWADGSYSIRDGNHRCVGGRLRGDRTILAHVITVDYPAGAPN